MTNQKYIMPEFRQQAFTCPHCGAYSAQTWEQCYIEDGLSGPLNYCPSYIHYAKCHACKEISIWLEMEDENGYEFATMVYPAETNVPLPFYDMPERIKELYNEARNIVNKTCSAKFVRFISPG